jgi:hypothetical protein
MKNKVYFLTTSLILFAVFNLFGQGDGLLIKDGKRLFPIGWYYMPKDDASLKEKVDAGMNLIRCTTKEDLDRLNSAGIQGWMPLNLEDGVTDKFKEKVLSVASHPALAVWEGPDEVVWNFTSWSGLYSKLKVHEKAGAWWDQTPAATNYANAKAKEVIPNMNAAVSYIRSVDPYNRQIWINEASKSDVAYVRQYLDFIDITGADIYPISSKRALEGSGTRSSVDEVRSVTQRYQEIGRGKPVWMILQAFSWQELGDQYKDRPQAYPSFNESRYMAYAAIAHGALGILYWGGSYTKENNFLQSLYAVTRELAALQPFLTSPNDSNVGVKTINETGDNKTQPLSCIARRFGRDWMIVVINETDSYQMGVVVDGLKYINGMKLTELYGNQEVTVLNEEIVLRMKPREVKVFTTGKKWESSKLQGRDYSGI